MSVQVQSKPVTAGHETVFVDQFTNGILDPGCRW